MKASNVFIQFLEQDDRNVLIDHIKNGDAESLNILDKAVTDKMNNVRTLISEKFREIFIKKKEFNVKNILSNCNVHK